jgi:methyl-accepting chemotaxis protein
MRSIKEQIPLIVMSSIIMLTIILVFVICCHDQAELLKAAETKAKSDLASSEAIIDSNYPGFWDLRGLKLYKGQTVINNNHTVVDYIKDLTGDECAIFRNNVCVSTTVLKEGCNRDVGIYAPYEVTSKALKINRNYTAKAQFAGKTSGIAYKPITNAKGLILGVLYVAVPTTPYSAIFFGVLKTVGLAGLGIALLAGLITRFIIAKKIVKPLQDAINGMKEITMNRTDQPLNIQSANEIGELTQVFSKMYVSIQKTENELQQVHEEFRQIDSENERTTKQEQETDFNGEDEWFETLLESRKELPKGLSRVTLKLIVLFLKQQGENEVTALDVSKAVNLSIVAVRNYFNYLSEIGLLDIEQRYGSAGRPLRFFRLRA